MKFVQFGNSSGEEGPKNSHARRRTPFPNVHPTKARPPSIRYGVTANIAAFQSDAHSTHAAARGSIPRIGVPFFVHPSPDIWPLDDQGIMGEGELAAKYVFDDFGMVQQCINKSTPAPPSKLHSASSSERCTSPSGIPPASQRVSSSSLRVPYAPNRVTSA